MGNHSSLFIIYYIKRFPKRKEYRSDGQGMNVLNLEHISKIYGDKVIFDDISCGIHQGDKIGIIGINGTGKTTFLKILAGLEEADEGQVITQNGLRITYLPQHPEFPKDATILSYVTQGQKDQNWNPETEGAYDPQQAGDRGS